MVRLVEDAGARKLISGSSVSACHNAAFTMTHLVWMGLCFVAAFQPLQAHSHTSNPFNSPPSSYRIQWNSDASRSGQPGTDRAIRDGAALEKSPECDSKLSRQRNDHDAPDASDVTGCSLLVPLAEAAAGLVF